MHDTHDDARDGGYEPRPAASIAWQDIARAADAALDAAAARHGFHPLHVEDCRHGGQLAKLEVGEGYRFVVLTLATLGAEDALVRTDLALFVGPDYVVTVHDGPVPLLGGVRARGIAFTPDDALYHVLDAVVDTYRPLVEEIEDRVDALEGEVLARPAAADLARVADLRATLLAMRRVLRHTRLVTLALRRPGAARLRRKLLPFLRDVEDHLVRDLEAVAGERDRLAGLLALHQSGVANRNNDATRLLTVLGTVALPALLVAALFGMNVRYPAWVSGPYAFAGVVGGTAAVTAALLWLLKRRGYF